MRGLTILLLGILLLIADESLAKGGSKSKSKKVKTTFRKLKCAACFSVVDVMRGECEHEWETGSGDTILVEKRKKKTKMSYADSELAVQEAVDRVCEEDRYSQYNVTSVNGVPRYSKTARTIENKEFRKHLSSVCQQLIADHEHDIVHFFYSKKGTSELAAAERAICTDITSICSVEEADKLQSNSNEGGSDSPEASDEAGADSTEIEKDL